jgi:hypothetical protein
MKLYARPPRRGRSRAARTLVSEPLESRLLLAQTTGVFFNDPGASDGLTLFSPNATDTTYLINKDGYVVNQWQSDHTPGLLGYLQQDGSLIRAAAPHGQDGNGSIVAAGAGGLLERFDWEGNKFWEFSYDSPTHLQHHDFEVMPNGNILLIAWELKTEGEATQAGRDPNLPGPGFLYPDHIVEVQPDLVNGGGQIVWEWHLWDHLVQDRFPDKDNYQAAGVAAHPELVNINYTSSPLAGGGAPEDWTHANGIDYNAELDQIVLSVREFSEIWIIDHSTTTAEAAGHTGGDSGRGGDLLYRWGNPQAYGRGDAGDRVFFFQHDPQWIEDGLPGEGHITVFNNGYFGPASPDVSSVEEIAPPLLPDGSYVLDAGAAYGPEATVFTYVGPVANFSPIISSAQRLPNGNTLIGYGVMGAFTEVTSAGEEVWRYVNPFVPGGMLGLEQPIPNLGIPIPGLDALLVNFTFQALDYPPDYIVEFAPPLRITEMMYHPAPAPPGGAYHDSEFEFVEFQNVAAYPIKLAGMQLAGGVTFTFPDVTLEPGEYAVVVENRTVFESRYGAGINVVGEYSGKLHDGGELVELRDAYGQIIHSFQYDGAWYPSTDGGGDSLVIVDPSADSSTWDQSASWQASASPHGSPGGPDVHPALDAPATVTGRRLFYNNSIWDEASFGFTNASAIAGDKTAYVPNGANTSTFANMSSYAKGINGIMVELTGAASTLTADDFTIRMSGQGVAANNAPGTWAAAPAFSVTLVPDTPTSGTDRYELAWADGAITNRYLYVVVEGNDALGGFNANTGLAASDYFFFGSMVGDGGSPEFFPNVDATDQIQVRANQGSVAPPTGVLNLYDFNRDALVDAIDQIIARASQGAMPWLSISAVPAASDAAEPESDAEGAAAIASALAAASESSESAHEVAALADLSGARTPSDHLAAEIYWQELGAASDPRAAALAGAEVDDGETFAVDDWLEDTLRLAF